ncbi:MAG: class I SAM-dependent methyltransferase [Bacteroidetes bacterium]|nr:class I SAM-dependent methyltransferase [Bacteroidota bacterium]
MNLVNRIFKKNLIDIGIKTSIITGRGSIRETFPSDFSDEEKKMISEVKEYTMTSDERLVALSRAIEYIIKNNLEGDIVECGVWRGGSMMLAAKRLIALKNISKKIFLFDTFDGMPPPEAHDTSAINNIAASTLLENSDKDEGNNVWCYSALDEVKKNISTTGYPGEQVFYFKGKVEDTLPEKSINKISLLRLDTDWYESTKHELEHLFDRVAEGGIIIIDDYGHWTGAKKAVDEFIEKRKLKIFLNRIDYTGRLIVK